MAENTNQQKQQQRPCPGDCTGCNIYQRNFCSSQLAHTNMKLITALIQEVGNVRADLKAIATELAASHPQSSDELINPVKE